MFEDKHFERWGDVACLDPPPPMDPFGLKADHTPQWVFHHGQWVDMAVLEQYNRLRPVSKYFRGFFRDQRRNMRYIGLPFNNGSHCIVSNR